MFRNFHRTVMGIEKKTKTKTKTKQKNKQTNKQKKKKKETSVFQDNIVYTYM